MAKKEDIEAEVRRIDLNDPKTLLTLVENPFGFDALSKLKNNYTGEWRDKVISFVENIKCTYDVDHIKNEIDTALKARSKQENFFANFGLGVAIAIGAGILYWIIFNFGTGVLLFAVLAVCFYIGYNSVNKISKQYFSGDTLHLINDFNDVIK